MGIDFGLRKGILRAIYKMRQDSVICRISSSVLAVLIMMVMKKDGRKPLIFGGCHSAFKPWQRGYAITISEPENFMRCVFKTGYSQNPTWGIYTYRFRYRHNPSYWLK